MADFIQQHKIIAGLGLALLILMMIIIAEGLFVMFNGVKVPTPNIPRDSVVVGSGPALSYVILGDSTAVAQGADYQAGFALATARHLATNHKVTMVNLGVSGARAKDVLSDQVPKALNYKPDLVLVALGANDVTHLTSKKSVEKSLRSIVDQFTKQSCDVKIVLTGAAQMGSVPRFPQPLQVFEGWRTTQLNKVFDQVVAQKGLTFARIAEATGQTFKQNPSLFAVDKFHPNAQGYAVWTPVLNRALDDALTNQTSHCQD